MNLKYLFLASISVFFTVQDSFGQKILDNILKKGDLVFDVGANIGNKTDTYLQKGAKVVCFEPQPQCVKTLRTKYRNNPNVTIEPSGLADSEGSLDLFICTNANVLSTFSHQWMTDGRFADGGVKWDKKITVPVYTLDQMINKHGRPNFIKIDVEGFEYKVLKGLTLNSDYLSFEFTQEHRDNMEKCLDILEGLGYKVFNFGIAEDEKFALANWVCRKDLLARLDKTIRDRGLLFKKEFWGDIYAKFQS